MKKFSVKIIFLCISFVSYCSFALLSSTTCGTANHQTYATWDDAKAARVSVGSCSGGEGYIQKDYNPVTSNMSFWNCTGWDGYGFVVTDSCYSTVTESAGTSGNASTGTCPNTGTKIQQYCSWGYIPDGSCGCRLPVCLANAYIGTTKNDAAPANSYYLSTAELPTSHQLTKDYSTTIVWSISASKYKVSDVVRTGTSAGCEYTCKPGYIYDYAP